VHPNLQGWCVQLYPGWLCCPCSCSSPYNSGLHPPQFGYQLRAVEPKIYLPSDPLAHQFDHFLNPLPIISLNTNHGCRSYPTTPLAQTLIVTKIFKYILGICLLGREHYDCTAGTVFRPGNVSATCGQVLATSGMAQLDVFRELRQCYLVNENSHVGGCWCGSWQGWLRWPRPGSGCRRQPGLCRWPPGPALSGTPPAPPTGDPRCTGGRPGLTCIYMMDREGVSYCTVDVVVR